MFYLCVITCCALIAFVKKRSSIYPINPLIASMSLTNYTQPIAALIKAHHPGQVSMSADSPAVRDDSHISFAKRLAHNNKDTRQAALKKVKRWLVTKSKQGTLDHDEIIKIWKGLHYSMWYSDKPLTQESLALDISQIVSLLPDIDDAISFFGGFCETIAREWVGIDRQRLDKFYMFIKTALKCVLEFCAANKWDDEIVSNVVDTLDIRIINSQCPDSISVFISEHLFSIYSEIYNDSTSPLFITEMLMCYLTVLSKTPKKDLSRVIMSNLFTPIISNSVSFQIDHNQLINFISQIATQPDILTRNRKLLYKLRNDIANVGGVDLSSLSPLGKHKLGNDEDKTAVEGESVGSNGQDSASNGDVVTSPKKKLKKSKQPVEKSEISADISEESKVEINDIPEEVVSPSSDVITDNDDISTAEDQGVEETPVTVDELPETETDPGSTEEASCVSNEDVQQDTGDDVEKEGPDDLVEENENETEEVRDAIPEEVDNETVEDRPNDFDEGVTKKDSNDNDEEETTTDHREETATDDKEETEEKPEQFPVIAPTEFEITAEVDSLKQHDLKEPDLEVTYSTPAKKTGKRKSTRSKKTPKKQDDEQATIENVEIETSEPSVVEQSQDATKPSHEAAEVAPSPKLTRSQASLRKRKKKSACQKPTPTPPANSLSTPNSAASSTKKKVRLSMENNQTFFFKKNTSLESPKPFDSTRTPVKGVLKSSPALTRSQVKKRGKSRVKS